MRCQHNRALTAVLFVAALACSKQPGSVGPPPDGGGDPFDGGGNSSGDAGSGTDTDGGGDAGIDGGGGTQADGGGLGSTDGGADSGADGGGGEQCLSDGGSATVVEREWAAWPIVEQPAVDAGLETVRDTGTGLVWQRGMSDAGILTDGGLRRFAWQDAIDYCAQLADGGFAGYGDWRLPTTAELMSIVDMTKYFPALDSTAFPGNANNSGFWTSSADSDDAGQAWIVNLADGQVYLMSANPTGNDPILNNRVRCVR